MTDTLVSDALNRFAQRNIVPPGGRYFYTAPETEVYLEHPVFYNLIADIRKHYKANDLVVPANIEQLVEDHMCRFLPDSFCVEPPKDGALQRLGLTTGKIREFTRTMFRRHITQKQELVSPVEADRRAQVCMDCPLNDRRVCTTCDGLEAFARKMLTVKRQSTYDPVLGVCVLCGCLTRVKIHLPVSIVKDDKKDYPENCWIREGSDGHGE